MHMQQTHIQCHLKHAEPSPNLAAAHFFYRHQAKKKIYSSCTCITQGRSLSQASRSWYLGPLAPFVMSECILYQFSFLRCCACAHAHSPGLAVDLVPILHRQGSRQPAGSCAHALPISASGSWTPQMRLMCVLPIWSAGAAGTLHRATKTYSLFLFFWPFWSEK